MATISKRGAAWRARIRKSGQLLTKTFDTKREAVEWAEREETRIAVYGLTAKQVRATPADMTVADLFDRYAREVSPTKRGARWEQIRLDKLARDFGEVVAIKLNGAALAEWRDRRLQQVSASSVNRELNIISAVYTRAIKEWQLPVAVNPASMILWPRKPHARRRRVRDSERAAILAALGWDGASTPADTKQLVAWAFCVALETMMRQGEILALTWQHVHLQQKYVHLPQTKNGHSRDVPLSGKARALFGMLPPGQPGNKVCPVNAGTFGVYFRRAEKAAGVTDLHFHDARREALTRLAPKFGNPMDLGAASGHRDLRSLKIYYAPDVTDLADKLD